VVNRLFPPAARRGGGAEPAAHAVVRAHQANEARVRTEFLACLSTDTPASSLGPASDLDAAAWAKLTETYRYDAFLANLSNFLREMVRAMPPAALEQLAVDLRAGSYRPAGMGARGVAGSSPRGAAAAAAQGASSAVAALGVALAAPSVALPAITGYACGGSKPPTASLT
jgi:hypothetical protein